MYYNAKLWILAACTFGLILCSCNNSTKKTNNKDVVADPEDMDESAGEKIETILLLADKNNGKIEDSIQLMAYKPVNDFYNQNKFAPVWSKEAKWSLVADSLFDFIKNAQLYGLFSQDYHFNNLVSVKNKLDKDSLLQMDASLWGKADIMLTDALVKIMKDLKYGRLQKDSIILSKDSLLGKDFYVKNLKEIIEENQFTAVLNSVQPQHTAYWELKKGIKGFLDSMDTRKYTYISYPYKKNNKQDSIRFITSLQKG
ncbi:MAG: hypothetical protein IPJ81_07750 [Chitinophagaceae bacterium]|nr:hypothetical protein [Chitinophagaceae bacterium]